MAFGKNSDIEVTRPLKHRPGVLLIKQNGTQKVIGDGGLFTPAEFMLLHGGYAEPTTSRLQFAESEQADIDKAEDRLTRASTLADTLYTDGQRLGEELRAAYPPPAFGDTQLTDEQADQIENIEAQLDELRGRIKRSDKLEHRALVERNTIRQRITVAARERQFPIEYHNPPKSLDAALTILEGDQ